MKAPFYRIYLDENGEMDLTDYVSSFVYEDSMKEDNLLKITFTSGSYDAVFNRLGLTSGKFLYFLFGYISGEKSGKHKVRITDIKTKYAKEISVTVVGLDLGTVVRKIKSSKVWKNKTTYQIAEEIADKYGFFFDGDKTKKVWKSLPQGNKSDLHFLEYLAKRESGGNWVVYIRNNTLYLKKKKTKHRASYGVIYGDPNGDLISFSPTYKESSKDISSTKTVVSKFDPFSGDYKPEVVDTDTEEKTGTLGSHKILYDANFNKVGEVSQPVVEPVSDSEEAKNLANSKKKSADEKTLTAKLVLVGNPNLEPNSIVTISNVDSLFSGNWLVEKVTHTVKTAGYVTTLDLVKNGTNKKTKKKADDKNESVGDKDTKKKKEIPKYNRNFERVN